MSKLSELNGQLQGIATELDGIADDIQTLKSQLADAEIPADAQATLDGLVARAAAINAEIV